MHRRQAEIELARRRDVDPLAGRNAHELLGGDERLEFLDRLPAGGDDFPCLG